mmetsp:Transcript_11960/g.27324  ORF Transcript_11960/g.27324 Transcript_11960/m.27324 type:complete len:259 (-) Transcript_11960:371-1147(-)
MRLLVHLCGALQEPGVQVENVTRVGLTTRRPAQEQGHLAVGHSLLRQVVIENHSMLAVVAEVFCHGAARVWRQELERCSIGGGGSDNRGVLQAIVLAQNLEELRDGGTLLANGHVDAVQVVLCFRARIYRPLVQDGVDGDGGLASLTVADDQLSLTTADGDQAVDSLQSGGHRLVDALPGDDARSLQLHAAALLGLDRALAINWCAQCIHDTAEQAVANGHVHNGTSALHAVALHNGTIIAEDHDTNIVRLQVQGHAL